jgi:hypothetical protein
MEDADRAGQEIKDIGTAIRASRPLVIAGSLPKIFLGKLQPENELHQVTGGRW